MGVISVMAENTHYIHIHMDKSCVMVQPSSVRDKCRVRDLVTANIKEHAHIWEGKVYMDIITL